MFLKAIPTINVIDITLSECTERYQLGVDVEKTGALLKGQALAYAKLIVKQPNNGTWKGYCTELEISINAANKLISTYKAHKSFDKDRENKNIYVEPSLPTSPEKYSKLKGSTPQEKADNFTEVRKATHKEEPTAAEIATHNKINAIAKAVTAAKADKVVADSEIKKSLRNSDIQIPEILNESLNDNDEIKKSLRNSDIQIPEILNESLNDNEWGYQWCSNYTKADNPTLAKVPEKDMKRLQEITDQLHKLHDEALNLFAYYTIQL